jgi:high-affinity iron transporter
VSVAVGAILQISATTLSPQTEAILAGSISVAAAGLVTWMLFWLAKTARSLAGHLRDEVDRVYARGAGISILLLAFFSVGREGIETALFIWAAAGAAGQTLFPLLGAILGLAISVSLGFLIYKGMTTLNLRAFFAWSGGLLILMVAGILSHGIGDWQIEAGILPGANAIAFDFSTTVPTDTWFATVMQAVLGISPVMTWLQVIVWIIYVGVALPTYLTVTLRRNHPLTESADDITSTASLEVVGSR